MRNMDIKIKEEYIKLDSALKLAGVVSTGGQAKLAVLNGEVKVNGEVCLQRGKKLRNNDSAEYNGVEFTVKSEK